MYVGIATDTGQFCYSSTTKETFEMVQSLLECGANPAAAANDLYENESYARIQLIQAFLASLEMHLDNRVCVGTITDAMYKQTGATIDDADGLVDYARSIKGVEIGAGNEAVELSGDENSDEIRANKNKTIMFSSNNSGGILGGISSGQDLNLSITIKPTSSILKAKKTINNKFQNTSISTKGRHDPCVGLRAVPIAEAMMACVLADHILRNRAQCG